VILWVSPPGIGFAYYFYDVDVTPDNVQQSFFKLLFQVKIFVGLRKNFDTLS